MKRNIKSRQKKLLTIKFFEKSNLIVKKKFGNTWEIHEKIFK